MKINENFDRCKKCNNPYFEKHSTYTILKNKEKKLTSLGQEPVVLQNEIVTMRCSQCNEAFGGNIEREILESLD